MSICLTLQERYYSSSTLDIDNSVIIGSSLTHIQDIFTALRKEFAMKDFDPLHFFFGIEIVYFDKGIHLNQIKHDNDILRKIDMSMVREIAKPLAQKHKLQEA